METIKASDRETILAMLPATRSALLEKTGWTPLRLGVAMMARTEYRDGVWHEVEQKEDEPAQPSFGSINPVIAERHQEVSRMIARGFPVDETRRMLGLTPVQMQNSLHVTGHRPVLSYQSLGINSATSARRKRVIELHAEGKGDSEMAGLLACTNETIRRDRAVLRLPANSAPRANEDQRKKELMARRAKVRAMIAQGKTVREMANEIGCTTRLIHGTIRYMPRVDNQRDTAGATNAD